MEGFISSSYDTVLIVWGIVWIVGGSIFMYLMHRAIRAESISGASVEVASPEVSSTHEATTEQKVLVSAGR